MYHYVSNCICCKKDFKILEGSRKYQLYKQNMNGKFTCDDCSHKVELDARKALFGKLGF